MVLSGLRCGHFNYCKPFLLVEYPIISCNEYSKNVGELFKSCWLFFKVKSLKVNITTHQFLMCFREKNIAKRNVIEMHFNMLHLNRNPSIHCYHTLPGGSRPPLRAKPVPSLMQRVSLTQVSAWVDLKEAWCTACSPWPECQNHKSCIIWQVIIIKTLKSQ